MKPVLLRLTALLLILAGVSSCQKTLEPVYPIDIPFTDIYLSGTSCTWKNSSTYPFIINDYEALERVVDCTEGEYLDIDFSTYTLMFVLGFTTTMISDFEKQFKQISDTEYVLYIDITVTGLTMPQSWRCLTRVPKIPDYATVDYIENIHY